MAPGTFGIIAPHPPIFIPAVGGESRHGAEASLGALTLASHALAHYRPDTVVLISPHAPLAGDAFLVDVSDTVTGSLSQFGDSTPYLWPGDPELACLIIDRLDADDIPCAAREGDARLQPGVADHATIVPLHYLLPDGETRVVVLSLSFLPFALHTRLGEVVAEAADDLGRKVAFVASGDLSHRLTRDAPAGFSPRGAELDAAIVDVVRHGRFGALSAMDPELIEAGGECGLRSIVTLGGFLGDDPIPTRVMAYEGPWGVGYLTALAGEDALDSLRSVSAEVPEVGRKGGMAGSDESEIVQLARHSIEFALGEREPFEVELTDAAFPKRAGAFVSLHRQGQLRGCIGTIAPTRPTLAEEVAYTAVQAALEDPRFPALDPSELADLDVKVDVLHVPASCEMSDLDPDRYGVIVTSGGRRGLLLPDLEGVDDVSTQVSIAMQKAGIAAGTPCALERFLVDRYV